MIRAIGGSIDDLSCENMNAICYPLKKLGISYFHYFKKFRDNSRINLSNLPHWYEHFYRRKLYSIGLLEAPVDIYKTGYYLWSSFKMQTIFKELKDYFDVDHGITIIQNRGKYIEICDFGGQSKNTQLSSFYLSNIDLLFRFILYFKERAVDLISGMEKHKIILPKFTSNIDLDDLRLLSCFKGMVSDNLRSDFICNTKIKRYVLQDICENISFSQREIDCLMGLLEAKTSPEIAKKLFISDRTVETHVKNIKDKMQCSKKSELIEKFLSRGLSFQDIIMRIFV